MACLLLEEASRTTWDSACHTLPLILDLDLDTVGLGSVAPKRSIEQALRDLYGMPPREGGPGTAWWGDLATVPENERQAAASRYFEDSRDAACAEDFVGSMRRLWEGEVVSGSSQKRLLDLMAHARTGPERILAGLPGGSWLAHKTGSLPDWYAADVGLARLPDGSHLIIAAHVWSESPDRDQVIARLTEVAVGFFHASRS